MSHDRNSYRHIAVCKSADESIVVGSGDLLHAYRGRARARLGALSHVHTCYLAITGPIALRRVLSGLGASLRSKHLCASAKLTALTAARQIGVGKIDTARPIDASTLHIRLAPALPAEPEKLDISAYAPGHYARSFDPQAYSWEMPFTVESTLWNDKHKLLKYRNTRYPQSDAVRWCEYFDRRCAR